MLDQLGQLLIGSIKPARQFQAVASIQAVEKEVMRIFSTPLPQLIAENHKLKAMAQEAKKRKEIGVSNFQYIGQFQESYQAVVDAGLQESQKYNKRQKSIRDRKLALLEIATK